jgi:hypothetical protein
MLLKDYIKTYDDFLDGNSCNQLIEAFNKNSNIEKHDTELYKFEQLNLNASGLGQVAQQICSGLSTVFTNYFEEVGVSDYIGVQGFEELRIKKYYKNLDYQFKSHIDVADANSMKRYLIAIIYLNDNDGATEFPQLKITNKPKKGSVIVFPPTWQYPHAGRIPTDTDKYIMMTSLHYT